MCDPWCRPLAERLVITYLADTYVLSRVCSTLWHCFLLLSWQPFASVSMSLLFKVHSFNDRFFLF